MMIQYLGFGIVALILICALFSIFDYIRNNKAIYTNKQNKKLLDNMKKLKK